VSDVGQDGGLGVGGQHDAGMAEHLLHAPPVHTRAEALAWLDAERASLAAAVAHMSDNDWPGHATRMAATLRSYLDRGGFPHRVCRRDIQVRKPIGQGAD
jgi:hypothetical protein